MVCLGEMENNNTIKLHKDYEYKGQKVRKVVLKDRILSVGEFLLELVDIKVFDNHIEAKASRIQKI